MTARAATLSGCTWAAPASLPNPTPNPGSRGLGLQVLGMGLQADQEPDQAHELLIDPHQKHWAEEHLRHEGEGRWQENERGQGRVGVGVGVAG